MTHNATMEYTKTAVMTASRGQLVVLMYDGAIRFVEQARIHMRRGNTAACGAAISRAYNIISELRVALDPQAGGEEGAELAANLSGLYQYMLDELVEANVHRSEEHLDGVVELLETLKDGWAGVARNS